MHARHPILIAGFLQGNKLLLLHY